MWFNQYPYINLTDLNLDFIYKSLKELRYQLENFVNINTIKYANPIQWNITTQYEANTVVINANDGTAYLSVKPVPSGVAITNTDYWTPIFTLNLLSANQNITLRDDGSNVLATFASVEGDWLIWNNTLYKVSQPINVNEAYVVGYNLERFSVELFIKEYINDVESAINALVGDLDDLNTSDKTSVVNAINSVLSDIETIINNYGVVTVKNFGAVGDGVTDDTNAFVSAFAACPAVIVPDGTYRITNTIVMPDNSALIGVGEGSRIIGDMHASVISHNGEPIIIKNIVIDRPAGFTAVSGDDGIVIGTSNFTGRGILDNIIVGHCYNGFYIKGGSMTTYNQLWALENVNNGFEIHNGRGEFTNCLAQYNKGHGYHLYQESDGETGIEFSQCGTFCNQHYGWLANVNAGVVNAANLMLRGANASFDGDGGFYIENYHNVWLLNGLSEYGGNATSFKPAFTSANNAVGIDIRNCKCATIDNMIVNHNKGTGIRSLGNNNIIFNSNNISDNGDGGVAGYVEGIELYNTTKFVLSGGLVKNIDTAYQVHDININGNNSGIINGVIFNTYYIPNPDNIIFNACGSCANTTIEGASDMSLPLGMPYVNVTGDHNIYTLGSAIDGQIVTLHFTGTGALVDGAYLHLSGTPLHYTPNSTVTLVFVGAAGWNELAHHIA